MERKIMKICLFLGVIFEINLQTYEAHEEFSFSSVSSSDEEEKRQTGALSYRREWQYEGLPIDADVFNRWSIDNEVTEASTTNRVFPPLDRRYRRIYNPDDDADISDYPFMAALLVNQQLWCGGVLIDRDTVLTAAHCLQLQYNNRFFREYVKMLTVRVGSSNATSGGEVLQVVEIFFHPNYKPDTLEFNFAVLKLHRNLTFGGRLVADAVPYSRDNLVAVNKEITFLGWGSVLGHSGNGGDVLLQKIRLPVYNVADCQEVYGRDLVTRNNNFCVGYITIPKNVCNHDAGGPAIMDGVLVGILSFSSKRCDQPDQPAVFSKLGAAAPWLEKLGEKKA